MPKHENLSYDNTEKCKPEIPLRSAEDVKQWEEARCPICMEHPHNAVLLQCSSYDKGCRTFMCNTSYRHSNCLDQFCKSSVPSPSTLMLQGITSSRVDEHTAVESYSGDIEMEAQNVLACPLCRGEIYGWSVLDPVRNFMNSKARSCSYEKCDFSGNYLQLRKHARSDHPMIRPLEVDPERQRDWARLEQETDFLDMRSLITFLNGEGEEEAEFEGTSTAAHSFGLFIQVLRLLTSWRWRMIDFIDPAFEEDDGSVYIDLQEWSSPSNQNINYRANNGINNLNSRRNNNNNNAGVNFNSRQNFTDNLGESASWNQNPNTYRHNNLTSRPNYRVNNSTRNSVNSRQNNRSLNYRVNNSTRNNANPGRNNRFRTNLEERMPNNEDNYRQTNVHSNRENTGFRSSPTQRMRGRRINNAVQNNNVNRRSRLNNSRRSSREYSG